MKVCLKWKKPKLAKNIALFKYLEAALFATCGEWVGQRWSRGSFTLHVKAF
jgi:hypothetical protein